MKKIFSFILLSVLIIFSSCLSTSDVTESEAPQAKEAQNSPKYLVQVVTQEVVNLNASESAWLPLQIQDKLKSNLQSYLGMKTVVDSKAESALKKLQAESENVGRDENTAIELGKITTAKFALFTKIRKVGANYVIAVDFTDLTTGEQLASCMSKEYSKPEYLYGNTGAADELTLALAEKLGIKVSELNKNYLTSGSTSFSADEQLALAKENEAQYKKMMADYDAELVELAKSNDINAIQNQKRIEAEKALLQEKQNAEIKRQAELQAQKERAEADKKLEAERSIELITQRDKLAQEAAAKAAEVRKLKMEKQGVLGQINIIESKKKALVEIRQGVENRSIELFNQMEADIKSEFERITNMTYSTVELGSDGQPTEQALTRRKNQRNAKFNELYQKFFADCESVKQSTIPQQNILLQEIKQDQTNLARLRIVNSMGDELKVSFGPYEGSKNGWNAYLSLYSDGILVSTDTVIVSYEAVAGKKAPNLETELNDAVIKEYANNVDMYNSLLARGEPIIYFELDYKVTAESDDEPSQYKFNFSKIRVINTISGKITQTSSLNKIQTKTMIPEWDLREFGGIVSEEKAIFGDIKKYYIDRGRDVLHAKNELYELYELSRFSSSFLSNFVRIPHTNYKILKTELSQACYTYVMGSNPSRNVGESLPVHNVSAYDALYFCNKASTLLDLIPAYALNGISDVSKWNYIPHTGEKLKGEITVNELATGFRLPTAAEWLYAASGGEENYTYAGSDNAEKVGHFESPYLYPVAQLMPNGYGLYDMYGNVEEITLTVFKMYFPSVTEYRFGLYGGSIYGSPYWDYDSSTVCPPSQGFCDAGFRPVCSF